MKKLLLVVPLIILFSCVEQTPSTPKVISDKAKKEEKKSKVPILGWHRTKEGYKAYNYNVLNMLAYFSYKVNLENGKEEKSIDWLNDPIIDSAQANNCSVYLTITNFGYSKNSKLLSNSKACDTLINRVDEMLNKRGATGVCVDFEEIHKRDSNLYTDFIQKLSIKLKKNNRKVIVVLPISFEENFVNVNALKSKVEYFVMMGYACYHLKSSHAGPVSPYKSGNIWEPYNINDNVDKYLGHSFPKEQFMVALPLYGTIWETESRKLNSRSIKGVKEVSYNQVMNLVDNKKVLIDTISQSSFYVYQDGKSIKQCWFESKENLAFKIDRLLNEKEIGGIGFWSMGYAGDHPDVWEMIKERSN